VHAIGFAWTIARQLALEIDQTIPALIALIK
jgi:hypothetical protein